MQTQLTVEMTVLCRTHRDLQVVVLVAGVPGAPEADGRVGVVPGTTNKLQVLRRVLTGGHVAPGVTVLQIT